MSIAILSAGAAKGLVQGIAPAFLATTGHAIEGSFGAVGAMRDKLLAGEPCDVIVLTDAMLRDLAGEGRVLGDTIRPIGLVATGFAIRQGDIVPDVSGATGLVQALVAASGIYTPDTVKSTAGRHFAGVLRALGVLDAARERLREFPNGATAMRAMADSDEPRPVGCTQVTEILYTPGVQLVGRLAPPHDLSTLYAVAVGAGAREVDGARQLVDWLTGPETAARRERDGFDPA